MANVDGGSDRLHRRYPRSARNRAKLPAAPSFSRDSRSLHTIEDLLPTSPAYRQVAQLLDPQPISITTQPLTPLHKGHIGLLSTAGLLNGRFGSGDRLHVAAWKTKKRVIRTEDSEDEKTIIREREQFVHELAIAFANGETALIE